MTFAMILKLLFTRTFIIYIIAFLTILPFLNFDKGMRNSFSQTLSRLTPPINYYKLFVDRKGSYDSMALEECINYHEKITYYFPFQAAEAYGMLGFCYYRLGDNFRAVEGYKRAIENNPLYFWPYYNLGVIAYNNNEDLKAFALFEQAIQQDPIKTVYLLTKSKVYSDVKASDPAMSVGYDFEEGVRVGYSKALKGMILVLLRAKKYERAFTMAIDGLSHGMKDKGFFYYHAGLALFSLGDPAKASAFFQKSINEDPKNAEAYYYLGLCLRAGGGDELAKDNFAIAARLHKQFGSLMEDEQKLDVQFF